ncbi:hypothetical protein AB3G33_11195 [Flavobacterium sp. WC2421]|uniref:hypothetical protein n=1 Tax=Flavobacterium sp. WC2421 TaxID=3234138 RepID=UPI003465C2DA
MKKIKYIVLIFSLFSFYCFSQKKQLLNEIPTDFHFEISDGGNNAYNSLYNNFYRTYIDSVATIKVELTKDEKERIYSFMKKISFHKMPNQFKPKEKIITIKNPSFQRSVIIYSNGEKKFVSYKTGFTSDLNDQRAKPFLEFYKMIWEIIYKKEQVLNLAESDNDYL